MSERESGAGLAEAASEDERPPNEPSTYTSSLTSEVGSTQSQSLCSENLSPSLSIMAELFKCAMTEMMNKISSENRATVSEMVKLIRPEESPRVRITDVYFPSYNPDGGTDVREWVNLISKTQMEYNLKDHEVRLKAAGVLKGRAKTWADDSLLRTTTWEEMRKDMLKTFEPESRYFSDVLKYRNYKLEDASNIPEYISNIWRMFKRLMKPNPTEADAVEFVIGSVDDGRIRTELLNSKSRTVPELISVAKTLRKRPLLTRDKESTSKRPRIENERDRDSPLTCFVCGNIGHRARECKQNAINKKKEMQASTSQSELKPPCFFCSKPGHTIGTCFKRMGSEQKNVNLCQTSSRPRSVIWANFRVRSLECMFDSGADCSLVRNSIAVSLPGRRSGALKCLKGIGPIPLFTSTQIETICEIDGVTVELELCVVQDHEIPVNIIIGRDLLDIPGIEVIISNVRTTVVRRLEEHQVLHVQDAEFNQIDSDVTKKEECEALRKMLDKYKHVFVKGYGKTMVNTGKLTIRLKDPNKTVQRRPYRLSPIEKIKLNKIIDELLENNIIRESKSPFASPVVLVKKKERRR